MLKSAIGFLSGLGMPWWGWAWAWNPLVVANQLGFGMCLLGAAYFKWTTLAPACCAASAETPAS